MQVGASGSVVFSFLIFFPEIRLLGGRVNRLVKQRFQLPLKSRRTDFFCTPDRIHNLIRSPRLAAYGPQNKVGKGKLAK